MSKTTPQAAALLQRARQLLEPEPEQLAAVREALARKLEVGAAPSCGELDALGRSAPAPRRLWTLGSKLGLTTGLTLLAGASVLVLRTAPDLAVPSAAPPPSAAHEPGPGTAAEAPPVSVMERAAPSAAQAPRTAATEPPAIAARPARTRSSGRPAATAAPELPPSATHVRDPLARAARARGARRAATAQPGRGTEPAPASADPSAASNWAATPQPAANSGTDQNAAVSARPAATPLLRQPATPAVGARVAAERARSAARAADEERRPGVRDRSSGEQQRVSSAPVPERDRLAREVEMLDDARAALERGDDARALQILDAHAREFPAGVLREEQLALRARALCALGRIDEGRRAVQRLAARAPESPHLKRSQVACGIAD